MSNLRKKGNQTILTPTKDRIGNVLDAINPDQVVTLGQLKNGLTTNLSLGDTTVTSLTSTGLNTYFGATSITAHAGGGQGSATALTHEYNDVTTVATGGDSVVLPTPVLGKKITVRNSGATAMAVFPPTGASIDGGSANASVSLQPGCENIYEAISGTAYKSNATATTYVSQLTNITTGVTCSSIKGVITTQAASAGAAGATPNTFTVTNTLCLATSHVSAYIMDYAGTIATNGNPIVQVDNRTAGTFDIIISNAHGTNALNNTLVIGFEIKN